MEFAHENAKIEIYSYYFSSFSFFCYSSLYSKTTNSHRNTYPNSHSKSHRNTYP